MVLLFEIDFFFVSLLFTLYLSSSPQQVQSAPKQTVPKKGLLATVTNTVKSVVDWTHQKWWVHLVTEKPPLCGGLRPPPVHDGLIPPHNL